MGGCLRVRRGGCLFGACGYGWGLVEIQKFAWYLHLYGFTWHYGYCRSQWNGCGGCAGMVRACVHSTLTFGTVLLQIALEWLRQGCWQKCGAVIVHVYATCLCGRWPWESIVLDIVLDLSWYLDLSWFILIYCWPLLALGLVTHATAMIPGERALGQ